MRNRSATSGIADRVLFEDDHLLVVDKPSGMLVHRGWGKDRVTLVDLVIDLLGVEIVHPVHRLDRGTSGAIVFAKTAAAARDLASRGSMTKQYLALVRGETPERGEVDHPIPRKPGGPRVEAKSTYRRLCSVEVEPREVSWVEVRIESGRLHQVRRHMKHISHPVIGDTTYGQANLNHAFARIHGLRRLALHARAVTMIHPVTGTIMLVEAKVPEDLLVPLSSMGIVAWES